MDTHELLDGKTEACGVDAIATARRHEQQTLTRQNIANAVFERCPTLSRREAKRLVDDVIDAMVETLVSGETLKLHDFGSFVVREKRERSGRNPRTGARVAIDSRKVVMFKASPSMKATVHVGVQDKLDRVRKRASRIRPLTNAAAE
jgi:integration host factor subunit alpha